MQKLDKSKKKDGAPNLQSVGGLGIGLSLAVQLICPKGRRAWTWKNLFFLPGT